MIPLPIANGLYNSRSLPISHQLCKNWYPGVVETQGLSQEVLFGTPGLSQIASTGGISRINRGSHTKEGIPFFVNGEKLYRINKTTPLGVDTFTEVDIGPVTGTSRTSFADNGNQLMMITDGLGYIYNEDDAVWTERTAASNNNWRSIAYGNDIFVAVSDTGTGNRVMTSADGITWTERVSAADNEWTAVCYGGGLFVAVSESGTGNRVMTSPDGITWTIRTSAADHDWRGVTYGDGVYVAVSQTDNSVMSSSDAITWTLRTSSTTTWWKDVAYGGGLFVAVGRDNGDYVMISEDGITWITPQPLLARAWQSITYGNGKFVAVSSTGATSYVASSTDGVNWVYSTPDSSNDLNLRGVTYGNGLFVAVGSSDVATSYDGELWDVQYSAGVGGMASGGSIITRGYGIFACINTADSITTSIYGGVGLQPIYDTDFYTNGTPKQVRYVDGFFVCTTDEKKVIHSELNNGYAWNALDFGEAESDPDAAVGLEKWNNETFIFGEETTEPFVNVGGSGFVLQRSGVFINKGALAEFGIIATTSGIAFLGAGKDESPAIWLTTGETVKLSHPGIDNELNKYSLEDIQACFAQYYSEAGEFFVSFTFPQKTFVYGFTSQRWHERSSQIPADDGFTESRWRVNSLTTAYGKLLAGDSIDGRIGEMGLDTYSEYGNFIEAQVASPNFSNQGEKSRYPKIEATMEAGVGNPDTPNPVLVFDYSDNGKTFKGARERPIGAAGKYNARAIWRRNGSASRYRTNRFTFTGKTKRTFIKLEADIEA